MKEGSFFIAYDLADGKDVSVLSVFVKEAGGNKTGASVYQKRSRKNILDIKTWTTA